MKTLLTLAAVAVLVATVESTTIHVPAEQPTLQAGVDASVDGDTVLVAPGVYAGTGNYNVDFGAKNLVVIAESGPDSTIVNCFDSAGAIRRGFILEQNQDSTSVLDGFTLRQATIGVYMMGSALIRNCVIDSNGIGVYIQGNPELDSLIINSNDTGVFAEVNSLLRLHRLSIKGNRTGVSLLNSSAAIHLCQVDSNRLGVEILNGTLSLVDVNLVNNDTAIGGAIGPGSTPISGNRCGFTDNNISIRGECTLTDCTIDGGAIGIESSFPDEILATTCQFSNLTSVVVSQTVSPKVKTSRDNIAAAPDYVNPGAEFINCIFSDNPGNIAFISSGSDGDVSALVMDSCLVQNNGGGIDVYGTLDMTSTLYAQNGRGIHYTVHKDVLFTHSIKNTTIAFNADTGLSVNSYKYLPLVIESSLIAYNSGVGVAYSEQDTTGTTKVTCTDVFGNTAGEYAYLSDQTGLNGNLSLDPYFCQPDSGDYTIKDISPCAPMNNNCSELIGKYAEGCLDAPPVVTSSDTVSVIEDSMLVYRVSFVDADGPDTIISIDEQVSWLASDADSIYGVPTNNTSDTSFIVAVSDGYKGDTLAVLVHVIPVNDSPLMTPIVPKELFEGTSINFLVSASDIDSDTLSLLAFDLPPNAQFVDSGNNRGLFSFSPDFQSSGDYVVRFLADDGVSADTLPVNITVLDGDPLVMNLTTPQEPDTLHVLSDFPLFQWVCSDPTGVYPIQGYELLVTDDTAGTTDTLWRLDSVSTTKDTVTYGGIPLIDGQRIYVQVRTFNGAIWSSWYGSIFRTNSIPTEPTPFRPARDSVIFVQPVLYVLNSFDADSDTVRYDFEVYDDSLLTHRLAFIEQLPEDPDSTGWMVSESLPDDRRYYWQARAFDNFEYSAWSPTAVFWLDASSQPPSPPTLVTPPDTVPIVYTLLPQLVWHPALDPDLYDTLLYRLSLSIDSNFTFVYVRDSLTDTSLVLTDSLAVNTRYWWKVRVSDRNGLTAESDASSFQTWLSGDVNHDHVFDIGDLVYLVEYMFAGGPAVEPPVAGDVDGSCGLDIADLVYMVEYAFADGPPPVIGCAE